MILIDFLHAEPLAFYVTMTLLGLVAGSFVNVVILRLPKRLEYEIRRECAQELGVAAPAGGEPPGLVRPRSQCPKCGHRITALENVPVLSWLWLRGRCSSCHAAISPRYPLIELASGVLTAVVAVHYGFGAPALLAALLTWALIALSMIDFDTTLLPDDITLPFLWLGIAANLFGTFTSLPSAVLGAMCGYLLLWSVFHVFRLLTGKEGMGYGDFKLLALLGAWCGWQLLPLVVVVSSLAGAVVGITLMLLKNVGRSHAIPFGPYLALAGWIALLWGAPIMDWYLDWSRPG
jgi:leader peptidase (prepilin peptidase)/N-methyltransferase